ncbi:ornithine--oxo-acid transaminase [Herbidospora sp. NEAU-GS84]|uniref:ornithine aminotransferase n=1 Tax=Herbidospora solisilvae TaxID=2696284 RepID=A0A7C9NI01_9ACTN|nr:ornithine--oxo-acid transaminase [Herbidospora solisilvae]NAS23072.1 ornithine--oxo-acid transaminase [Herbidospora solisilvae]
MIELAESRSAHNYHPLPVVIASAEGAWVTDVEGRRYLDCLAGYSSLNFGHGNPVILAAAHAQLDRVTLTSRAFFNDRFGAFAAGLAELCGKDMILPMNTGAEAVETAIKVARKWGHDVKGITDPNIVVMEDNFHGRTTTIVSFSTDPDAHDGFGPYTPGFRIVKYGSAEAIADAIDENTVAVLLEPIQGEAGVLVPPDGYLRQVRELCTERGVLMIADEIQSGLGRTGDTFACDHENVVPDMYVLGKALGGGVVPVSAVAADADVLGVIRPGQHGSTFGGNPLACAVGETVVNLLKTGEYQARARELESVLFDGLRALPGVTAVRGRGLWAGVDVDPSLATGRQVCERLMARGVLAKDTHGSTIRLAPPLVVEAHEIEWALAQLEAVLTGSELRAAEGRP